MVGIRTLALNGLGVPEADFWPVVDSYQLQDFQRLVCLTIAVRNVQNPANWLRAVAQLPTRNR